MAIPRLPASLAALVLATSSLGAVAQQGIDTNGSLRDAFADVNGIRLHYREGGTGPAVLLLHGLSVNGQMWKTLAPPLLSTHRVIIPDLRGHGESTNPSGVYRHADVATDLFELLDQLKIDKVRGVGHSSGAGVLLHMATRQPDRVEKMVLIGLGHRVTDDTFAAFRHYPVLSEQSPAFQKAWLNLGIPGGEAQINTTIDYIRKLDQRELEPRSARPRFGSRSVRPVP